MKGKTLFVILFFLLTGAISSAQVKLDRKSLIFPAYSLIAGPSFTQNTQTGDTLITWFDSSSDGKSPLVGRIVNGKGNTVGKAFTIHSEPHDPQYEFGGHSIGYNPITNEYLLAHSEGYCCVDDYLPVAQVFLTRLTPNGRPIGKAIDITSSDPRLAPYESGPGQILFYPRTGGYLIFIGNHGDPHVAGDAYEYYALLTGQGTLSGPIQRIDPAGGNPQPLKRVVAYSDYAFLPSGRLVALAEMNMVNVTTWAFTDYGLAAVDLPKLKNLKLTDFATISHMLNPDPAQSKEFFQKFVGKCLAFPSADSPVVYFTDIENLKGRKINASGKLSGLSFSAFNSPMKNTQLLWPSAAFSTTIRGVRGILIAVEVEGLEGPTSIWGQVLDQNGKPNGSPVKLLTTADTERIGKGGTIVALPVQPGDAVARFVWYGLLDREGARDPILKLHISLRVP